VPVAALLEGDTAAVVVAAAASANDYFVFHNHS